MDNLESEISSRKAGQIEIIEPIKILDAKVSETYETALETWGKVRITEHGSHKVS
ncbi:hypothetical protein AALA98_12980 [Lachnospiraceae bacterium 45-W7]